MLTKMAPVNLDIKCHNVSSWYQTFLTHVNGNGTHMSTNVQFYQPKDQEKDDKNAVLYIVVVLLFYSIGIIIAIIHYLKREKDEIEEEKAYENYVTFRSDPYKWSRYYRMQQVLDRLQLLDKEKEQREEPSPHPHSTHARWLWRHVKKSHEKLQKQPSRESDGRGNYGPVGSRSCDFPSTTRPVLTRTRSLDADSLIDNPLGGRGSSAHGLLLTVPLQSQRPSQSAQELRTLPVPEGAATPLIAVHSSTHDEPTSQIAVHRPRDSGSHSSSVTVNSAGDTSPAAGIVETPTSDTTPGDLSPSCMVTSV